MKNGRMELKQNSREKKGSEGNVNAAFLAFVITFLITITVGGAFLAVAVHNNSADETGEATAQVSSSSTRIPHAEKIMSESTADNAAGQDGVVTADPADDVDVAELVEDVVGGGEDPEESADSQDVIVGEGSVSLAFAGDILFDPGYAIMNRIKQNGGGLDGVIGASLLSYMRDVDVMVVNNEFPYSDRGAPTEGKTFTFRAPTSAAALLNQMGVDVATIANNHVYDYGEQALLDTLQAIDNVGVVRVGAGANIDEASQPYYFTASNGLKIAIIATTEIERLDNPDTRGATADSPGVFRCLDITRLTQRIAEAKATGAYVIVCIHWGTENMEEIDWWQQKQGPEMVAAGADLIIGAHPHILQKIDYIDDVPVVYSLGNYLFNSKTLDTGLVRVEIDANQNETIEFIPAIQSGCNVNEAQGQDRERILAHMREISPGINIDESGYITKK